MTCECCQLARARPDPGSYRMHDEGCIYCGARAIQRIQRVFVIGADARRERPFDNLVVKHGTAVFWGAAIVKSQGERFSSAQVDVKYSVPLIPPVHGKDGAGKINERGRLEADDVGALRKLLRKHSSLISARRRRYLRHDVAIDAVKFHVKQKRIGGRRSDLDSEVDDREGGEYHHIRFARRPAESQRRQHVVIQRLERANLPGRHYSL